MEAFLIQAFIGQRMAFLRKPKTFSLFTERQRNCTNLFFKYQIYDLLNSIKER